MQLKYIQTITKRTETDTGVLVEETDYTLDEEGFVKTISMDSYFE